MKLPQLCGSDRINRDRGTRWQNAIVEDGQRWPMSFEETRVDRFDAFELFHVGQVNGDANNGIEGTARSREDCSQVLQHLLGLLVHPKWQLELVEAYRASGPTEDGASLLSHSRFLKRSKMRKPIRAEAIAMVKLGTVKMSRIAHQSPLL